MANHYVSSISFIRTVVMAVVTKTPLVTGRFTAHFHLTLQRFKVGLLRTFQGCFLPSFDSFGQAVSEEKIFRNQPIRNKIYLWQPCLLMDRDEMSNIYKEPAIDDSYQVSVYLAMRFR